jgi:hypothetical protein
VNIKGPYLRKIITTPRVARVHRSGALPCGVGALGGVKIEKYFQALTPGRGAKNGFSRPGP